MSEQLCQIGYIRAYAPLHMACLIHSDVFLAHHEPPSQ
ncbi:hypothetical protein YPPY71_0344 [Yersinia pestis PY-71]|nr:hypothetical protein YPPY02_0372 [Yersinia pestis PY-02]EIS23440.1 hypothetical protein YPPY52_0383 [Yersinia pestis PY-52]EIS81415.1 hypothetical protein YPPY71_0344 [Yersinia pestis PY-71]